jgi:hypothetical protein
MFGTSTTARSSLVTIAVIAGLLAAAGPASATRSDPPSPSGAVDSAMLLHGDFSTFLTNQDRPGRENLLVFSGDAYDNEMGVIAASGPERGAGGSSSSSRRSG